jgi:hypothetical protein
VDYGEPDKEALTYILRVPSLSGTTPTLAAKIQESADNSNWVDLCVFPFSATSQVINAVGTYYVSARARYRYRRVHLTLGGTTPNYGAATVGADLGGDYNKF